MLELMLDQAVLSGKTGEMQIAIPVDAMTGPYEARNDSDLVITITTSWDRKQDDDDGTDKDRPTYTGASSH